MGPLEQLKLSKKKKIISYQKIKNSSKALLSAASKEKRSKKNSVHHCITGYLLCFYKLKILRLSLNKVPLMCSV